MDDKEALQKWCQEHLSEILGFPAGSELIDYMLSFESERDLKEHLTSLLDPNDKMSKRFLQEFFKKWRHLQTKQNAAFYQKADINFGTMKKTQSTTEVEAKSISHKADNRFPENNKPDINVIERSTTPPLDKMTVDTAGSGFLDKNKLMPEELDKTPSPFKKKNMKYIPLYSADGKLKSDTVMLPGRNACQCLAQKHKLINNCIHCGRIVCEQEGSGPCMFCGNLVCSSEEQEIISRESKKSKKLMEKLLAQSVPEDDDVSEAEKKKKETLEKALAHKNRLLEFDKNCTKRTKVIDDEADYFSMDNRWLSKGQREKLEKKDKEIRDKRFTSRRDKKIVLDFAGRRVIESQEDNYAYNEEDHVNTAQSTPLQENIDDRHLENSLIDPRITIEPPKYNGELFEGNVTTFLKKQQEAIRNSLRLQDKELQEMGDQGMCLSMHQPWASLLVHGIKKLEGRSWYSSHRGRLWIASAAKEPDLEIIKQVENQYRMSYPDENLTFPKDYPTAALLGCVNVLDCLSNEDYFEKNPADAEENNSPYLFVCDNAQQLRLKFQMKGKHKIYKLDSNIHKAAQKSLRT